MSEEKKNTPVIRISVAGTVGDKCQISFETYVDVETPKEVMNALVDRLMSVRDRQLAYYEVKDLERLFEIENNQLHGLMSDLDREDQRQAKLKSEAGPSRTPYKLPQKDVQARENIVTNVKVRKERLAKLVEDINNRKALVGERYA